MFTVRYEMQSMHFDTYHHHLFTVNCTSLLFKVTITCIYIYYPGTAAYQVHIRYSIHIVLLYKYSRVTCFSWTVLGHSAN